MKPLHIKIGLLACMCAICCTCCSRYHYYKGHNRNQLLYILLNSRIGGENIVLPKTAIAGRNGYIPHLRLDSFYVTLPDIKVVGFTMTIQMTDYNRKAWYRKWKWYDYNRNDKVYVSHSNKLTDEMRDGIWYASTHICGVTFDNFKLEGGDEFYHKYLLRVKPMKIRLVNDNTYLDGQYGD